MEVRFWGVRGSIAVSGAPYMGTGGNTSCVEVVHDGHRLILDGGTGLRALGDHIGFVPVDRVTLLFSHVHWDHIQGVPFFTPFFNPANRITVAGAIRDSGSIRDALAKQMKPPTFPITLDFFNAQLDFADLPKADGHQTWETGPFCITPLDVEHPDGVCAFRIEAGGRTVVYATDVEHGGTLDERLVKLCEGADLLVHDAQYTEPEYTGKAGPSRKGWGHSMWTEAVEVGKRAGVGQLALFHHDPARVDEAVAQIEREARERLGRSFAAREGLTVAL